VKKVVIMLKMKKVSETYDLRAFTDSGDYFGDVEDSIVAGNKVFGWKIRATKNSFLSRVLGSAKGVIVPHQLTKAVGDILIISKNAVPSASVNTEPEEVSAIEEQE
jgi:sporulation protein YlmC with PRC-barrel domain